MNSKPKNKIKKFLFLFLSGFFLISSSCYAQNNEKQDSNLEKKFQEIKKELEKKESPKNKINNENEKESLKEKTEFNSKKNEIKIVEVLSTSNNVKKETLDIKKEEKTEKKVSKKENLIENNSKSQQEEKVEEVKEKKVDLPENKVDIEENKPKAEEQKKNEKKEEKNELLTLPYINSQPKISWNLDKIFTEKINFQNLNKDYLNSFFLELSNNKLGEKINLLTQQDMNVEIKIVDNKCEISIQKDDQKLTKKIENALPSLSDYGKFLSKKILQRNNSANNYYVSQFINNRVDKIGGSHISNYKNFSEILEIDPQFLNNPNFSDKTAFLFVTIASNNQNPNFTGSLKVIPSVTFENNNFVENSNYFSDGNVFEINNFKKLTTNDLLTKLIINWQKQNTTLKNKLKAANNNFTEECKTMAKNLLKTPTYINLEKEDKSNEKFIVTETDNSNNILKCLKNIDFNLNEQKEIKIDKIGSGFKITFEGNINYDFYFPSTLQENITNQSISIFINEN